MVEHTASHRPATAPPAQPDRTPAPPPPPPPPPPPKDGTRAGD